jgi:hypothetical protein
MNPNKKNPYDQILPGKNSSRKAKPVFNEKPGFTEILKNNIQYFTGIETLPQSKYKPSNAKDPDTKYYSYPNMKEQALNYMTNGDKPVGTDFNSSWNNIKTDAPNKFGKKVIKKQYMNGAGLGQYKIDAGEDESGKYISIYDTYNWDLIPGKGYELYDRIYETDYNNASIPKKEKGGVISMKKNNIKKAKLGIQEIKDFTANTKGLGLVGQGLGLGLTALTQSKMDDKYTSQLGDANQAIGKGIGNAAGTALNAVIPGLGSIASPILGAAGGALQGALQKKKLKGIKQDTDRGEANDKFNAGISNSSIQQASQFKDGGKVKKANPYSQILPKKPTKKGISSKSTLDSIGETINTGVTKTGRKILPINVAMYAQDLTGNVVKNLTGDNFLTKGSPTPLTEKDLKKDEIDVLKKAYSNRKAYSKEWNNFYEAEKKEQAYRGADFINDISKSQKHKNHKSIGYEDYGYKDFDDPQTNGDLIKAITDPVRKISTTIGRANYNETDKGVIITDKFNFDGEFPRGTSDIYGKLHTLISNKGSNTKDKGIPVNINLGKVSKKAKGGTSKQQVIEIEGKKTPEIHTDKNFNLKNLGTTPHSKGGDKVLAEEGDVIFPTQDSPQKYNKVMKALREKDIPTLKKEQAKLPKDEDSVKKYNPGTKSVTVEETKEEKLKRLEKEGAAKQHNNKPYVKIRNSIGDFFSGVKETMYDKPALFHERRDYLRTYGNEAYAAKYGVSPDKDGILQGTATDKEYSKALNKVTPASTSTTETKPQTPINDAHRKDAEVAIANGTSLKPSSSGSGRGTGKDVLPKGDPVIRKIQESLGMTGTDVDGKAGPKTNTTYSKKITGSNEGYDVSDLENKETYEDRLRRYNKLVNVGKAEATTKPEDYVNDNPPPVVVGGNSNDAMELAPIAYNLGKGLFGKVDKVERNYLTPEKEQYNDMSQPARAKSAQMYNSQKSNARNLSGGSIGNMRSNMQQAANEESIRQSDINNQEVARQDGINSRNTQLSNNVKGINLDLKNKYNEIDEANKGAKEGLLQAGLVGLGQIGTRNKIFQAEKDAQEKELERLTMNSVYDTNGKLKPGTTFSLNSNSVLPTQGLQQPTTRKTTSRKNKNRN